MESLKQIVGNEKNIRLCRMILPNELRSLLLVERVIESICQQTKTNASETSSILLATSEALCNVIEYSYGDEKGREIILEVSLCGSLLTVSIFDEGYEVPHNIVQQYRDATVSMPSIDVECDDLPESGWGVNMLVLAAEEVRYSRTVTGNQLEIDFKLS